MRLEQFLSKARTASPATSWRSSPATICSKARGITVVAASAPAHFVEDTPTAILVRQALGAIAEFAAKEGLGVRPKPTLSMRRS
jgi:hypothetical protein